MRPIRSAAIIAILGTGLIAGAARAETAAVVEQVTGTSAGVRMMDQLAPGKVIRLAAGEKLVLEYLKSCQRETITGGTVTIGAEKSTVAGGAVTREQTECDGGLQTAQIDARTKSGVMVFRGGRPPKPAQPAQPAQ